MTFGIPQTPDELTLQIERCFDGAVCSDDRLSATVSLSRRKDGLLIRAQSPLLHDQSIPEAPKGTRVGNLWNYDVVEVFLVGPGHRYLEIELGAGGHWLVLGFDRIRHRENEFESFSPTFRYWKTEDRAWVSQIVIPWEMIPENIRAMNAFMIAAGKFLAWSPVPGVKPDFHQPDSFPSVYFA